MREHKPEVGKGASTDAEPTASAAVAGKHTLPEDNDYKHPHSTIHYDMQITANDWDYVFQERQRAVTDLGKAVAEQPKHKPPASLIKSLAGAALNLATDNLVGQISNGLAKGAASLLKSTVLDAAHREAKLGDPGAKQRAIDAFVSVQTHALSLAHLNAKNHVAALEKKLVDELDGASDAKQKDVVHQAKSIKDAFERSKAPTYQSQYNISMGKWFSAEAQPSFGAGGAAPVATDLSGKHLDTDQERGDNTDYRNGYANKQGFVHLGVLASWRGGIEIEAFSTPGIPQSALDHRDPAGTGGGSFASKPLRALEGGEHVPVVADVRVGLKPDQNTDERTGREPFQPLGIGWNEHDAITAELHMDGDYIPRGADRTWLDGQVVGILQSGGANVQAASSNFMRNKIGARSIDQLAKKPKDLGK